MTIEDVKNLEWVQLKNWDDLPHPAGNWSYAVTKLDVDYFIYNLFSDIEEKTGLTHLEFFPLMRSKNSAFFKYKDELFNKRTSIHPISPDLDKLKALLFIPDVFSSDVDKLISAFNELSTDVLNG